MAIEYLSNQRATPRPPVEPWQASVEPVSRQVYYVSNSRSNKTEQTMLSLTIFAAAPVLSRGTNSSLKPGAALSSHDQEIEKRRISPLFAQNRSQDRQASQSRHLR